MKEIKLSRGKVTLIDDDDCELVSNHLWHASMINGNFYAMTHIEGKKVFMHRLIMGVTDKTVIVDHKFHNTLDNRKHCLRICTSANNNANRLKSEGLTSKYKGVSWSKEKNLWIAQITVNYKRKFIGYFQIEENAAIAYNKEAVNYQGEFSVLNQISGVLKEEKVKTTSKYFGVYWDKQSKRWKSYITVNKNKIYIGAFKDETMAALAFNDHAKKHLSHIKKINHV